VGVGKGVPTAIEWIGASESEFVILEDDCMPLKGALDWFDQQISRIDDRTLLISGYSPIKNSISTEQASGVESRYPMIWGWATTRQAWGLLKPKTYSKKELFREFLKSTWTLNSKIGLAFFTAAQMRVQMGTLKAWDAPVALNMLFGKYRCLIPTRSLIENVGDDAYASHAPFSHTEEKFLFENFDILSSEELEKVIETTIYKMRFRHLFSPIRALLFN
jgi:hypothetical protein